MMKNYIYTLALSGAVLAFGAGALAFGLTAGATITGGLAAAIILTGGAGSKAMGYEFKLTTFLVGLVGGAGVALAALQSVYDAPRPKIETSGFVSNSLVHTSPNLQSNSIVTGTSTVLRFNKSATDKTLNLDQATPTSSSVANLSFKLQL